MADIIQLLPDSIANQIAAGEVIQRPASVVKELMENAIDAGSTEVNLIIKDAGKTLIQIIDNGTGMSETDARMAFERHATSKIRTANDLFTIRTMGFRGEALASIAAIAQVELITRQHHEDLANRITIEGSVIKKQEIYQGSLGTTFTVKNLFFNVPARRKFLKSDPVELRHIMDEFHRVALANPQVFFTMHHNGNEVYHLPKGNHRQRIVNIFGRNTNEKLVPIDEDTEIIKITGYIGKPSAAKRTKGEQFIFVNDRFIKSNYLNHAIRSAYDELIAKELFPFYILYMEMDPAKIDINVHPTKTEIKFEDERLIYNYVKVAAKHALGAYSITPSLDFSADSNFIQRSKSDDHRKVGSEYLSSTPLQKTQTEKDNLKAWESIYQDIQTQKLDLDDGPIIVESKMGNNSGIFDDTNPRKEAKDPYQIHSTYIVSHIKSGFLLIDQQCAHERILYEKYLKALKDKQPLTQKELFATTIELDTQKATILKEILIKVNCLGFEIEEFGQNTFVIQGIPSSMESGQNPQEIVEVLISQYSENLEFQLGLDENIARSMAYSSSIKRGQNLDSREMRALIDQLFACVVPYKSPFGRKCFIEIELEELYKRFIS